MAPRDRVLDLTTGSGRGAAAFDEPFAVPGVWPPPRPRRPRADPPTIPLPVVRDGDGPQERSPTALGRWVPPSWRGIRINPGGSAAAALVVVAALGAVAAAVGVWTQVPRAQPVDQLPVVAMTAEPAAAATPPPTSATVQQPVSLVVAVSGKVHRPGLVEVPAGSRVADVLEAAGGALPGTDLNGLNLARRVADGEQVAVGVLPAPDAAPAPGAPTGPASGIEPGTPEGRVNLNTATPEQLDGLPGVGPVTAQRIVEWRTRNGRFTQVEQLREIEGIGERRFAQLRDLVAV